MKTSARARFFCTLLLLLSWTNVYAQLDLGPNKLLNAPAPTLNSPSHMRIKLRSRGFVGRVGGVAFGATAAPAGPLSFANLSLSYRPEKRDGDRLWVTVDGRDFRAPIYDWQLVPIARFADSPYKSCVTIFGELNDREEGRRLLSNGDGVLNYHPAFNNTLLGLRLFQFDIIISEPYATELPAQNGRFLLGEGESQPDRNANIRGWNALARLRIQLGSELGVKTRSYVINDEGRAVSFDLRGGSLNLTGDPYVYFWLYKSEFPGYDEEATRRRIREETVGEVQRSLPAGRGRAAAEKEAYVRMILRLLQEVEEQEATDSLHESIAKVLRINGDLARRNYLKGFTTESIRNVVISQRYIADAQTVIPLPEYSERISREGAMMRRINPTVWDAGVNVMRYAAFFRYYKARHPAQWQAFLSRLSRVPVSPQVETPTIMKRSK